jgi:hypothetical protein
MDSGGAVSRCFLTHWCENRVDATRTIIYRWRQFGRAEAAEQESAPAVSHDLAAVWVYGSGALAPGPATWSTADSWCAKLVLRRSTDGHWISVSYTVSCALFQIRGGAAGHFGAMIQGWGRAGQAAVRQA